MHNGVVCWNLDNAVDIVIETRVRAVCSNELDPEGKML